MSQSFLNEKYKVIRSPLWPWSEYITYSGRKRRPDVQGCCGSAFIAGFIPCVPPTKDQCYPFVIALHFALLVIQIGSPEPEGALSHRPSHCDFCPRLSLPPPQSRQKPRVTPHSPDSNCPSPHPPDMPCASASVPLTWEGARPEKPRAALCH